MMSRRAIEFVANIDRFIDWKALRRAIDVKVKTAVAAEREACAEIAEERQYDDNVAGDIAYRIRARGKK